MGLVHFLGLRTYSTELRRDLEQIEKSFNDLVNRTAVLFANEPASNFPPTTINTGAITGLAAPTAKVKLTPVDGLATTAMRSDAAPALDQTISPTMTGTWVGTKNWTWTPAVDAVPITINKTDALVTEDLLRVHDIDGTPLVVVDNAGLVAINCEPDSMLNIQGGGISFPITSGLLAWYRADSIEGVSSGGNVSTWQDSSGNGNHLTSGGSDYFNVPVAVRPRWYSAGAGGAITNLPMVGLSGSNSSGGDPDEYGYFTFDTGTLNMTGSAGWTICMITRDYKSDIHDSFLFGADWTTDSSQDYILMNGNSTPTVSQFSSAEGASTKYFSVSYPHVAGNETEVDILRAEAITGTLNFWKNGVLQTPVGGTGGARNSDMAFRYIGRVKTGVGTSNATTYKGFAEIAIFNRSLTDDEVATINDYLNGRMGGTTSLTSLDLTRWQDSTAAILSRIDSTGKFGYGVDPGYPLDIRSTTAQQRLGYDANNYFTTLVANDGAVTFDSVGDNGVQEFTFLDPVNVQGNITSTGIVFGTNLDGATDYLPKWTDGPGAVFGNSRVWDDGADALNIDGSAGFTATLGTSLLEAQDHTYLLPDFDENVIPGPTILASKCSDNLFLGTNYFTIGETTFSNQVSVDCDTDIYSSNGAFRVTASGGAIGLNMISGGLGNLGSGTANAALRSFGSAGGATDVGLRIIDYSVPTVAGYSSFQVEGSLGVRTLAIVFDGAKPTLRLFDGFTQDEGLEIKGQTDIYYTPLSSSPASRTHIFTGGVRGGNLQTDTSLKFKDATGSWYTQFAAANQTGDILYSLPAADAAGVLTSNGGGTLSWGSTAPATAHNVLSATHGDTLADTVVKGDLIHGNATPKWARLAGNTTAVKQFLTQTGTGSVSAVPTWGAIATGDINALTNTWANVQTFTSQDVHNGGISLGSSGALTSTVAIAVTLPTTSGATTGLAISQTAGSNTGTGYGGPITFTGGAAGSSGSGLGGAINFVGGAGTSNFGSVGGAITFTPGAGSQAGGIKFIHPTSGFGATLNINALTADRGYGFPNAGGVLALTSDIPAAANPTGTIGVSAVNGVATTFMRSDAAPAFDMTITRNWTAGVHTFTAQDVHNAGVSLGTSGVVTSAVANSGSNIAAVFQQSVKFTGSRPFFEVDWYNGTTHQPAFTLSGQVASGLIKEMRLLYDASNYLKTTVNSVGVCQFTAVGTAPNVGFSSANTITFTAGSSAAFSTPSVVLQDGIVFSNAANTVGSTLWGASDKGGFFGVTPVVRPGAFTQTYATASHTHANPTAVTLTDNTAGTANTTLEALTSGVVYATDVAAIRNNFADLAAAVNALVADMANVKQVLNASIDDSQLLGLKQ